MAHRSIVASPCVANIASTLPLNTLTLLLQRELRELDVDQRVRAAIDDDEGVRDRIRDRSGHLGSFATKRDAEAADEEHQKRTLGDGLDAWLRAIKDQRSHDEYESRMRLYIRPTFDRTPLVKITTPKMLDLRTSFKEREEPIGNATINTLFASLSAAFSYFIEQGWCSETPVKFIRELEVAERPFLWLQSAAKCRSC